MRRFLRLWVPLVLSLPLALTDCGGGTNNSTPPPPPPPPPPAQQAQLTVTVTGSGTVTSSPAGINCPGTCTAKFNSGTTVTLTATAASGFNFAGFGGGCSGTTCTLTLSSSQSVTAIFNPTSPSAGDITAINHIIILLQENRTMDHYFGHLPDYWKAHGFPQATNGTTFEGEPSDASNVDSNGATVTAYNLQSACTENPSPSWNESHVDRNRYDPTNSNLAPMDGFVHTAAGDASGFGLYDVLGHRAIGYFVGDNQVANPKRRQQRHRHGRSKAGSAQNEEVQEVEEGLEKQGQSWLQVVFHGSYSASPRFLQKQPEATRHAR